jgi:hypothetical protein
MKTIIVLVLAFVGGYFTYHILSGSKHLPGFHSSIPIAEINENPGSFTDTSLDIEAKIIESVTLMNYTKSTISDKSGSHILLICNKPYKVGEEINLKAHLYVLFQKQDKQCIVLIDDNFKMVQGVLHLMESQIF